MILSHFSTFIVSYLFVYYLLLIYVISVLTLNSKLLKERGPSKLIYLLQSKTYDLLDSIFDE